MRINDTLSDEQRSQCQHNDQIRGRIKTRPNSSSFSKVCWRRSATLRRKRINFRVARKVAKAAGSSGSTFTLRNSRRSIARCSRPPSKVHIVTLPPELQQVGKGDFGCGEHRRETSKYTSS